MIKLLLILLLITPFIKGQSLLLFGGGDYVYAGAFNGTDEYCIVTSPTGLDLNGDILITSLPRNSTFEANATDWADNGTHSITVTSDDPLADTYSGLLVATGVGDADNNTSLAVNKFTALVDGSKYTFQIIAQSTGILGGDLVTDGTFDGTCGVEWNCQTGWTIGGGMASGTATTDNLIINDAFEDASWYYYSIEILNYVGGSLRIELGGLDWSSDEFSGDGIHTGIILTTAVRSSVHIDARTSFTGDVDNFSIKKITVPDLTVSIGGQSKTWEDVTPVDGGEMLVWKFGATSNEVDKDILLYLSQADDGFRVDDIILSQTYDATIMAWIKSSNTGNAQDIITHINSNVGWSLTTTASDKLQFVVGDGTATTVTGSADVIDGTWKLVGATIDATGNVQLYVNGATDGSAVDITGVGQTLVSTNLQIGYKTNYFNGQIGETKVDIAIDADYTTAEMLVANNLGARGRHFLETGDEDFWVQWKGNTNTKFLSDETGNNDLTGVNFTRADDQIKINRYKD